MIIRAAGLGGSSGSRPLSGQPGPAQPDSSESSSGEEDGDVDVDEPRGELAEREEDEQAPSPRHRLRDRRAYWAVTMHTMGLVCALTLSVLQGGFRMDWDPDKGPAPPAFLRNHPSAFAEAAFVAEAIATGSFMGTTQAFGRDELTCILPLGVAVNSAGKRRLIWDGRHVNRHLRKRPFRMEAVQREGRALFERSSYGGTLDISSAYHHVDMTPEATAYLGFEWAGTFYKFNVLPFGLSSSPWLFTIVMGHCVKFLDLIFGSGSTHGAVELAQRMIRILRDFGWLNHPTKCVGTFTAAQAFVALARRWAPLSRALWTWQRTPTLFLRPRSTGITVLLSGPPSVGVRVVAR